MFLIKLDHGFDCLFLVWLVDLFGIWKRNGFEATYLRED